MVLLPGLGAVAVASSSMCPQLVGIFHRTATLMVASTSMVAWVGVDSGRKQPVEARNTVIGRGHCDDDARRRYDVLLALYHRFPGHRWTLPNHAEVKPGDPEWRTSVWHSSYVLPNACRFEQQRCAQFFLRSRLEDGKNQGSFSLHFSDLERRCQRRRRCPWSQQGIACPRLSAVASQLSLDVSTSAQTRARQRAVSVH
jgi:hypothetical protein